MLSLNDADLASMAAPNDRSRYRGLALNCTLQPALKNLLQCSLPSLSPAVPRLSEVETPEPSKAETKKTENVG